MNVAMSAPERMVCVWIPDWSVVAYHLEQPTLHGEPIVVMARVNNREVVVAVSPEAREHGVQTGMRRREAESYCPALRCFPVDTGLEARMFERVTRLAQTFTARIEINRFGRFTFPARGPVRYFGGEEPFAREAIAVLQTLGLTRVNVGIADGVFAAWCASRRGAPVCIVPAQTSAAFLAPLPMRVLGDEQLADLAARLGVHTLGDFAALPAAAVLARFGAAGAHAHALASGCDVSLQHLQQPTEETAVRHVFEPPAQHSDVAAFAAKKLADDLAATLQTRGMACTQILVQAEAEHGETFARSWRHDGPLDAAALADRVRWQLDAWLQPTQPSELAADEINLDPGNGLVWVQISPEEVVAADGKQIGFWGQQQAAAERAQRACARLQSRFGPQVVATAQITGGRLPHEQVQWVAWGDVATSAPSAPWPGRIPGPAPARVFQPAVAAELLDAGGHVVSMSARGDVTSAPAQLRCRALPEVAGDVVAWAGPWAHDVRWWDAATRRRGAVWQIRVRDVVCLVVVQRKRTGIVAIYD